MYNFLPDLGGGGLRIVYGFLSDFGAEAYGLFAEFYRMWRRRFTDCLRSFTGCKGGGLLMAYGFLPDLGEEAYGLFTDFYRM